MSILSAAAGAIVALGLVAAAPATADEAAPATPTLCQMVEAFDAALQLRFYRANFAPDRFDCRFYGEAGCPYSVTGPLRIKVTHVAPIGCEADGRCAFLARQICETDGPSQACRGIMSGMQSEYRVSGRFSEQASGGWRLTDWVRDVSARRPAEEAKIAAMCPSLRSTITR
ncbi:MAG: hypothetical protein AAGM38_13675 [Pseudomonadota bacterium]